jgi:hypothetical protein
MGGKLLLGVAVAEEGTGATVRNIRTYGKVCNMTWGGSVTTLAKTQGEAAQDKKLKQKLLRLADQASLKIK